MFRSLNRRSVSALVLAAATVAMPIVTRAQTFTVDLGTDLAPGAVTTTMIANTKTWILAGGGAIAVIGVVIAFIKGFGRKSSKAVR